MADENEVSAMWREYREAQRERRASRLPTRQQEILALTEQGHTVKALTDYQFRVDGVLDLYPTHRRWHHLPSGKRGNYATAAAIAANLATGGKRPGTGR